MPHSAPQPGNVLDPPTAMATVALLRLSHVDQPGSPKFSAPRPAFLINRREGAATWSGIPESRKAARLRRPQPGSLERLGYDRALAQLR
jgi:hypothetical protein